MGTCKNRLNEVVLTCTQNLGFEPNKKEKIFKKTSENYYFYSREILQHIAWASLRNVKLVHDVANPMWRLSMTYINS